jgi:hypothetical protein
VLTLQQQYNAPGQAEALTKYYTTCDGSSPFQSDYDTAFTNFQQFNQTYTTYYAELEAYLVAAGQSTSCLTNIQSEVRPLDPL